MKLAFALAAALAIAGCAPCLSPAERAARHGVVLECRPAARSATACSVSTDAGDRVFTYRSICK